MSFHSLLHASIKNFFNEKLGLEDASEKVLKKLEQAEQNFHHAVLKRNQGIMGKILALKPKNKKEKTVRINPFNDYLNLLLCFLSWRKFSVIDINQKNQTKGKSPVGKISKLFIYKLF